MKRACVIGWPVEHSRSPLIHGYWLDRYGIAGSYDKRPVEPGELVRFLADLPDSGLAGCNVTIPHKEAAYRCVTPADAATRRLAAVNTLYLENGELYGTNTDGYGFLEGLKSEDSHWQAEGCRAVVLGAGGAARAVVGALVDAGAQTVTVVNRTQEKADALAALFGSGVRVEAWSVRDDLLETADLLVNATALGMVGKAPLEIRLDALSTRAVVCDIVYVPLETALLADARARGLRTVDGLWMLLHQAIPGFERWFGVKPKVTAELRALVVAKITGR